MRNEQSVFPSDIDPLIFYSDADLDNHHYLAEYYNLIQNGNYLQASEYIQNIDQEVDFYGAWLLNLYENELYAIETNMDTYVSPDLKPKLTFHGSSEPTDSEFKTWVYCGIDPGIPEPITPPEPMLENVLYEDGQFNKSLMPSGFTNFDDMLVTYTGMASDQRIMYNSLIDQYFNTPHIIQMQGNHAESWECNNGLKRIQTTIPPAGTDETDIVTYYSSEIIIPVIVGDHDYSKVCITYELGGTFIGVAFYRKSEEDLIMYYEKKPGTAGAGTVRNLFRGNHPSASVPQEHTFESAIDSTPQESNFNGWLYVGFLPKLSWSEVQVKKIWFE